LEVLQSHDFGKAITKEGQLSVSHRHTAREAAEPPGHRQSAIRVSQSTIRNPRSAIRNPKFAIRNLQSAIANPKSTIRNPRSAIRNPKFAIHNLQSAILLLLLLSVTPLARAQETVCDKKLIDLPQAPELFGFRPGLTIEQVKLQVPQIEFGPVDDLGFSKTTFNPAFDPRIQTSTFAGARSISLEFLDGRLSSLWIGYDSSFKWKTVSEFVREISLALKLPDSWQTWRLRGRQLRCRDFQMNVIIVAEGASLRILDLTADDIWAARRAAREEKLSAAETNQEPQEIIADKQTRLYYTAGCQPEKPISDTNRLIFHNSGEAESAGYKLGRICQ